MADSDSDHFESADEGFSDVEDERLPSVMTSHSSGCTTEETIDDNILYRNPDGSNISSTLENLSLHESKLSLKNTSFEEKQFQSSSGKSLLEDSIQTKGEKAAIKKSEIVNVNFQKNFNSLSSIVNSAEVSANLCTTKSHELDVNILSGCSAKSSQSLQPACDSTPSSSRTNEFKNNDLLAKPKLESAIESLSCNSELPRLQSSPERCDSNPSPTELGFESNLIEEGLNEIVWNDGLEIKSTNEIVVKSTVEKNLESEKLTKTNYLTTSKCEPSTKDNFREENTNECSWNDELEVRSTVKETSRDLFQSTDIRNESISNSRSLSKSNMTKRSDEQKAVIAFEKTPKFTCSQSSKLSSRESMLNSTLSLESNVNEENVGKSSWEVEDFETGSVDAINKTTTKFDLSKVEDSEDAGWEDDWDTEEVTFNTDLSKDGNPPSSKSKIPEEKQTKIFQNINQENLWINDKNISNEAGSNEPAKLQGKQDGWFGWGVTNILSSATEGLSSITSNVTSAFETTIGAPNPTELLQTQKEMSKSEEMTSKEEKPQEGGFADNLFSVSSWTKFVESTGSKVLTTGLDTLETIGKKTMEVIQEGDPGLKKKRAKLREFVAEPGKPVLSQVLREAKERAETSSRTNEAAFIESRVNFEILFDDFEGLVHLEALEMISKQCQIKLDSLALKFSGNEAKNFKETLLEIEELCELPEDDETNSKGAMADSVKFKLRVQEVLAQLGVDIQYDKLLQTNEIVESRLQKDYSNPLELHQIVISSLAEISAAAMQIFHRAAEMLVIKSKHSTVAETDSLMSFGKLVCSKLEVTAEEFSSKLKKIDPSDVAKVSHISKEATNSMMYTQNACQLLVPILQYGAVV